MKICAIDIGSKNLAFGIEEINVEKIKEIKNIPKILRYNYNKSATENFEKNILENIYSSSKSVLYNNSNVQTDEKRTVKNTKRQVISIQLFKNISKHFDQFLDLFSTVDIFLIEKQMSFGKKTNNIAVRISQHCISYLLNHFEDKEIIEYPAYYKTQILGCSEKNIKKWSFQKAKSVWEFRKDEEKVNEITKMKKKDDISDCLLHILSFCYLRFVDCTI